MAADRYDAPKREKHWQAAWEKRGIFHASEDDPRPKYYVLEMFPYPSGRIHMGHVRNYTMGDVVARYMRAKGHNVLHPMGWDAFGLPAENAAIERGVHPAKWTYDNIAVMRGQLKSMGLSLDWSRELATCDLDYYHQQQRLFLDMRKAGLVDRKTRKVNWDPVDRTVLANEQVIDGRGWRSGALVEQREQPEWVFKITDYAQDLLQALDGLERWPEKVRLMQANWIGRSEGLARPLRDRARLGAQGPRPDRGVHHAARHAVRRELRRHRAGSSTGQGRCREGCRRRRIHRRMPEARHDAQPSSRRRRRRASTPASRVRHPVIEGAELPVLIANFIVMEYGTGAIFGCPAHDQRDLEFARAKGLPVIPVVLPADADAASFAIGEEAYTGDGTLINSGFLDGLSVEDAKDAIADALTKKTAERQGGWRAADAISSARLGHLAAALLGLPDPDDPLPDLRHRAGAGGGSAGEASRRCELRQAGQSARPASDLEACDLPDAAAAPATRETDTMDTFVDSSWYFARFCSPHSAEPTDIERRRLLAAGRSIYRRRRARDPASPLCALLHPRHAQDRSRRHRRTVQAACSPKAW